MSLHVDMSMRVAKTSAQRAVRSAIACDTCIETQKRLIDGDDNRQDSEHGAINHPAEQKASERSSQRSEPGIWRCPEDFARRVTRRVDVASGQRLRNQLLDSLLNGSLID